MKTKDEFLQYSLRLTANLEAIDGVLGLIFLGSTADLNRVDEWSDHDFWVVVKNGQAESFRQDLSWLPDFENIRFAPRETQHGLKVMYETGHILEFAIFDDSELEIAAADDYSVPLDKSNITTRITEIAARSLPGAINPEATLQIYLTTLVIGVGRARRGETIVANQFVHSFALGQFLALLKHHVKPVTGEAKVADTLNPFRRVEIQYPEVANNLAALFTKDLESAAAAQLALVEDALGSHLKVEQRAHIAQVRSDLGWS